MTRRSCLLAVPVLLAGCSSGDVVCPQYKAFDGVILDYRGVDLPGSVSGELCVDELCRSLADWGGTGAVGRVNLALPDEQGQVRLRVLLASDMTDRKVRADRSVELLPVYNAEIRCGVYGRSRAVTLRPDGSLVLGGTAFARPS